MRVVSFRQKFGAFIGYLATMGASTGLWMVVASIYVTHPIATIPFAVAGVLTGTIGVIGSCARLMKVADDGWPSVCPDRECKSCKRLREENAHLLEAIK